MITGLSVAITLEEAPRPGEALAVAFMIALVHAQPRHRSSSGGAARTERRALGDRAMLANSNSLCIDPEPVGWAICTCLLASRCFPRW